MAVNPEKARRRAVIETSSTGTPRARSATSATSIRPRRSAKPMIKRPCHVFQMRAKRSRSTISSALLEEGLDLRHDDDASERTVGSLDLFRDASEPAQNRHSCTLHVASVHEIRSGAKSGRGVLPLIFREDLSHDEDLSGRSMEPSQPSPLGDRVEASREEAARSTPSERRSEEHTSELQSPTNLVCRLLLEKKKIRNC